MLKITITLTFLILLSFNCPVCGFTPDTWPDGEPVGKWFSETGELDVESLGRRYVLTDAGICPDGELHTSDIQTLIDRVAADGGGVIVVPAGVFRTGALRFRQGTHLCLEEGAVLLGSGFIGDYFLETTRIEGQNCKYFSALVNADGVDGFTVFGKGVIDGNGENYYRQFWLRRKWNPQCTNKDEQRPRLLYVSNSTNVRLDGVTLKDSPYWTSHFYKCSNVRITGCRFLSPCHSGEVKGPSTDAIDLDVVENVHIKGCYMCVNDDAVALKGGKGPYADTCGDNGTNGHILIEDCEFGFCHSCLTLGSESVHDRNVILRKIRISEKAGCLLRLKCRPDTPQHYEYVTVEDVSGQVGSFFHLMKWTQFYDLQGRKDLPVSTVNNITMRRCDISCDVFFNAVANDAEYRLSDFTFEDLKIKAVDSSFDHGFIDGFVQTRLTVAKKR